MFIVVSNIGRIPPDLDGFVTEQWSAEEFLERASSEDGIELDEGIYYDVSYLTADIYEALKAYADAGITLVYYRYSDKPNVTFAMSDEVKVYDVNPKPEPKPEPIKEPEVKMEPEIPAKPEPEPEMEIPPSPETQVLTSMDANPQYQPNTPPQVPNPQQYQTQQQVQQAPPTFENVNPQPQQQFVPQQPQQQVYQQPPVQQPQMQQPFQPVEQPYNQFGGQQTYQQPPVQQQPPQHEGPKEIAGGIHLADGKSSTPSAKNFKDNASNLLQFDDYDAKIAGTNRKAAPAKVILFGSSKGGTGKTFTCLVSAYWYAKKHPYERVAMADFDIIDGQIGITINKIAPTMQNFYKQAKGGNNDFLHLNNCMVKSEHFSPNIDFYLAPSQDIPQITNDTAYWTDVFKLLISNYDVVFFDSGIDYLGKAPISQLYKIADKIIITCNPSINSVKSVIKQFKTLSGIRANNVFRPGDDILSRTNVVLTRVYDDPDINDLVVANIVNYAPVIAAFGNIDSIISKVQWYQQWNLIDENSDITNTLDIITNF